MLEWSSSNCIFRMDCCRQLWLIDMWSIGRCNVLINTWNGFHNWMYNSTGWNHCKLDIWQLEAASVLWRHIKYVVSVLNFLLLASSLVFQANMLKLYFWSGDTVTWNNKWDWIIHLVKAIKFGFSLLNIKHWNTFEVKNGK